MTRNKFNLKCHENIGKPEVGNRSVCGFLKTYDSPEAEERILRIILRYSAALFTDSEEPQSDSNLTSKHPFLRGFIDFLEEPLCCFREIH